MEHRLGLRRLILQPVHLWTPGGVASVGVITSVSISGAYVSTALNLPLLTRVGLCFAPVLGRKPERVRLDAHVVRQETEGLAVEWCEFAPSSVRELIRANRAIAIERDSRSQ